MHINKCCAAPTKGNDGWMDSHSHHISFSPADKVVLSSRLENNVLLMILDHVDECLQRGIVVIIYS